MTMVDLFGMYWLYYQKLQIILYFAYSLCIKWDSKHQQIGCAFALLKRVQEELLKYSKYVMSTCSRNATKKVLVCINGKCPASYRLLFSILRLQDLSLRPL